MLVIGKVCQYDEENLPVRGQCEPYTDGWRLRIFRKGTEEVLVEDIFAVCRQVQERLAGTPEAEIRTRIPEILAEVRERLKAATDVMPAVGDAPTDKYPALRGESDPDAGTDILPIEEMDPAARGGVPSEPS
jgi:hypothetical protein